MIKRSFVIGIAALAAGSGMPPAFGQAADEKLGKVHFETSCTPQAQQLFDRGMLISTPSSGIAPRRMSSRM